MKIKLIGTGSLTSESNNASTLIDGDLLIDCGNGIVKSLLRQGVDIDGIRILLISHLHGDHFGDVVELIMEKAFMGMDGPLKIYGPAGLEESVDELCRILYSDIHDEWKDIAARANVKFEDAADLRGCIIGEYLIDSYEVVHGVEPSYAFTIRKGGKTVAISGDTGRCDNLEMILEKADFAVLEMSNEEGSRNHLGIDDIAMYRNRYQKEMIVTHMSDRAKEKACSMEHDYIVPDDGQEFVF